MVMARSTERVIISASTRTHARARERERERERAGQEHGSGLAEYFVGRVGEGR